MKRKQLATLFVLAIAVASCAEDFDSSYQTFADAERAGEVSRGWLPAWTPKTATNIHEWHNIDTNATLVAFQIPPGEPLPLTGCSPAHIPKNPGSAEWWPSDREFAKLRQYRCEEKTTYADGRIEKRETGAAVDSAAGRVFFWR